MVRNLRLSNFSAERNALINVLNRKIAESKTTRINGVFDNKFLVNIDAITDLLKSIDMKFKRCEMLYYAYFENLDHGVLNGNPATLPLISECNFIDGTAQLNYSYKVDDRYYYKDLIDMNFQNFILQIASLYENIVFLAEILMRKVMVYVKPPLSSPLHDYLLYLERLISLGYRQNDKLNICMIARKPYFDKYLVQINALRNRYIHGYSVNLSTDGGEYFVDNMDRTPFSRYSPDLLLNVFTREVLDNTRLFITELLIAFKDSANHHSKKIPV